MWTAPQEGRILLLFTDDQTICHENSVSGPQFPHLKEWGLREAWVGFLRAFFSSKAETVKAQGQHRARKEREKGREREIPRAATVREAFLKEGGLS